jgi:DNA-binding CsgD family transcriptional regulator
LLILMNEDLLELIDESAFVPELWSKVLDRLADMAGAHGGGLYMPGPEGLRWKASDRALDLVNDYIEGRWYERTKRRERIRGLQIKGFISDKDLFFQEEVDQDPIYREFLWPRGFGWAAAARIPTGEGRDAIVSLEREYARGPVERSILDRLNAFHPHLCRSAMVARRLRLERARTAAESLALLGVPALVLDFRGCVLAANDLVETQARVVRWLATDRIGLKDKAADASLKTALKQLASNAAVNKQSFPARVPDTDDLMVVHVIPIRGMARDVFGDGAAMIALAPVSVPKAPSTSLIQAAFGLSSCEARIAGGLAAGATLDELAAEGGVSRNTVRSQLRAVMEKTGCARQAEIAVLLSRLNLAVD